MKIQMYKAQWGFTMTEVMLAVAIMGIMSAAVAPSFQQLMKDRKLALVSSAMAGKLSLARSESIKRRSRIGINAIDGSESDDEWGSGFTVWVDLDGDNTLDAGTAEEIALFDPSDQDVVIDVEDKVGDDHANITLNSRGALTAAVSAPLSILVCNKDIGSKTVTGRVVSLSFSGQVRIEFAETNACS